MNPANSTQLGQPRFQISGQLLIKGSCHNSKASNDIDMKLEPVTKLENKISL